MLMGNGKVEFADNGFASNKHITMIQIKQQ